MSGSGGPPSTPPSDPCERLNAETTLNSPVRDVVSQLKRGDTLEVAVAKEGTATFVVARFNGKTAGTITSAIVARLAECIESDYEYVAEVLSVQSGAVKVRVHAK